MNNKAVYIFKSSFTIYKIKKIKIFQVGCISANNFIVFNAILMPVSLIINFYQSEDAVMFRKFRNPPHAEHSRTSFTSMRDF